MTDYTPGPWFHDGRGHINKGDEMSRIAITFGHSMPPGFTRGIPEDEQYANAQLIASAPRLKEERDEAVAIARDLFWLSGQMRHAGGVSTTRHDAILRKAGKTLERIDRENR